MKIALALGALFVFAFCAAAAPKEKPIHGLWVWKGPALLEEPRGAEKLADFCRSQDINEVYISIPTDEEPSTDRNYTHLIDLLHGSRIKVQALLSSTEADQPGKHRERLLSHVRDVVEFDRRNPEYRYDGIHLDIEPQQRPENKGPDNLRFLPGLVEAYRQVRALAEPARLTVNADIQKKILKGEVNQRRAVLTALPYFTLMAYELSDPSDGQTFQQKADKVRKVSRDFLENAYEGLHEPNLANMVIALRTPDYEELLPKMLNVLDEANDSNPHYRGWARHSYNDTLK
jgi:hypothetical protein